MYGKKKIPVICSECGKKIPFEIIFIIIRPYVMLTLYFQSDSSMSMIERASLKLRRCNDMIHDPLTTAPVWLNGY